MMVWSISWCETRTTHNYFLPTRSLTLKEERVSTVVEAAAAEGIMMCGGSNIRFESLVDDAAAMNEYVCLCCKHECRQI